MKLSLRRARMHLRDAEREVDSIAAQLYLEARKNDFTCVTLALCKDVAQDLVVFDPESPLTWETKPVVRRFPNMELTFSFDTIAGDSFGAHVVGSKPHNS